MVGFEFNGFEGAAEGRETTVGELDTTGVGVDKGVMVPTLGFKEGDGEER